MSAARVAKLQALLERVQARRTEAPTAVAVAAPSISRAAPVEDDDGPILEVVSTPTPPVKAVSPTPMEHALTAAADEPVLEIVEDDEPELTIDVDEDDAPTAPIGTPSPVHTPAVSRQPTPAPARKAPVAARAPEPGGPQRVATAVAKPSAPVARVSKQASARTFGELLERTLALRPR